MIDLHCHILPGVDDGPATVEDAVDMAQAALRDGVRTVVATPHGAEWAYTGDEAETLERVAALRWELARREVELELLPGLEVFLTPDAPALLEHHRIYPLNGSRYVLLEFPLQSLPTYAEQTLFELQVRQRVPVLAHPERNSEIAADLEIVRGMVERGMLVQITAASLLGSFGTQPREAAEQLVERRMAHIIASDAHSTCGRSPVLSRAVERAAALVGAEVARAMVTTTPAAILRNESVEVPDPLPARRRSWFPFGRKKS